MNEVCPLCEGKGYKDIVISNEIDDVKQSAMKLCPVCGGQKTINTSESNPKEHDPYKVLKKLRDELRDKE
jgi:predicted GNAT family acetyltransferase